eukprot:5109979-Prymnesium_polylepis.1
MHAPHGLSLLGRAAPPPVAKHRVGRHRVPSLERVPSVREPARRLVPFEPADVLPHAAKCKQHLAARTPPPVRVRPLLRLGNRPLHSVRERRRDQQRAFGAATSAPPVAHRQQRGLHNLRTNVNLDEGNSREVLRAVERVQSLASRRASYQRSLVEGHARPPPGRVVEDGAHLVIADLPGCAVHDEADGRRIRVTQQRVELLVVYFGEMQGRREGSQGRDAAEEGQRVRFGARHPRYSPAA